MASVAAAKPVARLVGALLAGTVLAGAPALAQAQDNATPAAQSAASAPASSQAAPAPAPAAIETVKTISVAGAERLEPQTVLSYIRLRPGDVWTEAAGDQVLKDLYATELFSNVSVAYKDGNVTITITENPVVNRIILEGNKRIKNDKIMPEIKLSPRQIFTRSKVRADVDRIIELYKRQGRFAATVEPQMVKLPQNRVDVVFEISEGPKSKVRQINIIGNHAFSDSKLRGEMVTKQARLTTIFSSNTSYDPDRLAFDQQKLRQFYLTQGYADFRVVSAVAELTPDKRDFIITYVVEEGKRYKFGKVNVKSELRDFDGERLAKTLPMKTGDWYNAKEVEDTVDRLTDLAGTFGYAFADIEPQFHRNPKDLTMDVTFDLKQAPRVYVERVDVNGNTLTQDKVIRREFRLAEGDAFNTLQVKRTTARIKSLGYFQENFEVSQKQGSSPDKIILEANVEEKPTGELQLSAGFSSLESFILQASIKQRNFRGRGQTVGLSVNYSQYGKSAQASFVEPYLFDRSISLGVDVYRKDYSNFNFLNSSRNTTFQQTTTGASVRLGTALTEYVSLIGSYTLNYDQVTLDPFTYFTDRQNPPLQQCDPLLAGRYLCDALGNRLSSILGLTLAMDTTDSRLRPTRGRNASLTAQFAGLGGDVSYLRIRGSASQFWSIGSGFVFSLHGEGGAIRSFKHRNEPGVDDVLLTDRFFLGEGQFPGFDIRGLGPRVLRYPITGIDSNGDPILNTDRNSVGDDALGGDAYYLGKAELEIPLGSGAKNLGIRPSLFLAVGSVFNVTRPILQQSPYPNGTSIPIYDTNGNQLYQQVDAASLDASGACVPSATSQVTNAINPNPPSCLSSNQNTALSRTLAGPFQEQFLGDSPSPRISVGIGINWNSPFGPLRIDIAKVLRSQPGDDTKTVSFNVGTQF
ncbi:outer membrane protein assembly factor BamA [Porphyrobacter algicida]|uniref:Outer membrane protein assembly factor BamA n=1 Tax=Qipengyuania algicida TaxID=1836209 RepID=A0A845AAP8_9SPHN|nr:outer membrane protein assembly factor BamA [Qipengyuania algicida]MXP27320.1 outer membrane protein assembly factor BamA [Qipengyuania algicida]